MTDTPTAPISTRAIDLRVDVPGTPEEVWEAVATGPGVTSWFVPAEMTPGVGGSITLHFGIGIDETTPITVWEPPRRLVYAEQGGRNLAFEWQVEARDGGVCTVRLINSGFGTGDDWDGEYESMTFGWKTFLANLALVRTHFPGQTASSVLSNGSTTGAPADAFVTLKTALGLPSAPTVGDHVATSAAGVPALSGTVVRSTDTMVSLLLDAPTPGTAFLAAEPFQGQVLTSLYVYLFGDAADDIAGRDGPGWQAWMTALFPSPTTDADNPPMA
jgi:uncharacterized protein YndB with AHSA1/START domain